jgi:hypothetical protein
MKLEQVTISSTGAHKKLKEQILFTVAASEATGIQD